MGRFKYFLTPFTDDGVYGDEIDITDDVDAAGSSSLKQSLDNTEYDIGIFKNNGLSLTLINTSGRFSDVGSSGSIFKYRRANSKVRIAWEIMDQDTLAGFCVAGEFLVSPLVDVFAGLLNDDALKHEAEDQNLSFKVLGKESIFSQVAVPFADIADGDTFEEILFACLNQAKITELLTVDVSNITCGTNIAIDAKASLENKTVLEALNQILLPSNSVLFIKDDTVYVSPRTATPTVQFTFYGQASLSGMENIIDISDLRNGLNRTFNYWTWADTILLSVDQTSVDRYGIRKKEIGCDLITDTLKRETILDALRDEFGSPKRELVLKAPMDYDTTALSLLDRVAIDYPNIAIAASGSGVPLWDSAVWDTDKFPLEVLPIEIDSALNWKVLTRSIDPANQELIFELREV